VSSDTEDVRGAATGAADATIAKVVKESIEGLVGSCGGKWMLGGSPWHDEGKTR
jgi:hypothetical protein